MSKERELLNKAIEMIQIAPAFGMYGLKISEDFGSELIQEIQELLAQPEQDKVDFQTLNELGLKRLQVSDTLVLQESCSKSPTLIFAENGEVIEIIGYKKLLEIRSFIDEILNQELSNE